MNELAPESIAKENILPGSTRAEDSPPIESSVADSGSIFEENAIAYMYSLS
jgi:hypothetical protein